MKTYRVSVKVENTLNGPAESSEIALGHFEAETIGQLVDKISKLGEHLTPTPNKAVSEHEKLVAAQNKGK